MKFFLTVLLIFSGAGFLMAPVVKAEPERPAHELRLKNHKFDKEVLRVKANEKFTLKVFNDDSSFEEFESKKMVIEKFVNPKGKLNSISAAALA